MANGMTSVCIEKRGTDRFGAAIYPKYKIGTAMSMISLICICFGEVVEAVVVAEVGIESTAVSEIILATVGVRGCCRVVREGSVG